jgi:protein-tyrosine-phosphatase/biotin carboxylase
MTVLVLDGHSRAALETLQSLSRAGLEVDVAAESPDCLALKSSLACRRLSQPGAQSQRSFLAWLSDADRERDYDLIVPATESSLLAIRGIEPDHPLRRKAVLASNEALDVALDKQKTWHLAQELRIPAPSTVFLDSLSEIGEGAAFPVILKPARSKVMIGNELRTLAVALVHHEAQRREQLKLWLPYTPVLQQQYVFGRGIGVEFLYDHGRKSWHFAHERLHEVPLSGGASSYRRSIDAPAQLLADAEKLLDHLRWHGVAMVEFKLDDDGRHWLMEINPRLWGSLALAIDAGVDFPMGLLHLARGAPIPPQPSYVKHFYTRDLRSDVAWFKANLRANHDDRFLFTQPRLFSLLEFLRPLTGRESWDHFDWRDLGTTRRIISLTLRDFLRPALAKLSRQRKKAQLIKHHRAVLRRLTGSRIHKIVFVCLGNVCRSPFAAGLAARSLPRIEILSAGFHHVTGRRCPEKILLVGKSFGIDLAQHRSKRIAEEQVRDADLILAMDFQNIDRIKSEFPEVFSRTTLLGMFANPPQLVIPDPYAAGTAETRRACESIDSSVKGVAAWLEISGLAATQRARPQSTLGESFTKGKQDA